MEAWIPAEPILRLAVFLAVFGAMAVFELVSPRLERPEMTGALKSRRWFTNLSMVLISSLVLRLIFPAAAVGAAAWAEARGWGLFRLAGVDGAIAGVLSFAILDFAVWLEHVASHKVPLLWRIHRMHHVDTGFDVTTGVRFHPLEIVLSMLWKAVVVIALGSPVISVLIFEVVLNATSMFNHSNIRIGKNVDRVLRRVMVTPDMHRVHHSSDRRETDSNYGFNFPFWDWLFETYVPQPRRGHEGIDIGLTAWRGNGPVRLGWSLMLPFKKN
jgi:sterol desaturase/sphingolipid hydroxylase (fatty acid hydroxylase superfamily)